MTWWNLVRELAKVRSRKRQPSLPRLFSSATVNTDLRPTGSVLAGGELWAAETLRGNSIQRRTTVTVVGFRDHRLIVEERS
jgi:membrane-bound ClpP family serine protease